MPGRLKMGANAASQLKNRGNMNLGGFPRIVYSISNLCLFYHEPAVLSINLIKKLDRYTRGKTAIA
jgi:hypothetical protein